MENKESSLMESGGIERGESCSACHRSHRKCDKKTPCTRCVKKGPQYAEICKNEVFDMPKRKKRRRIPYISGIFKELPFPESVPDEVLVLAHARAVYSDVYDVIMRRLRENPEPFVSRFGEGILVGFEEKLRKLPGEQLNFVDEMSRTSVDLDSSIDNMFGNDDPMLVQRLPSFESMVRQKHEEFQDPDMPTVYVVNKGFEDTFGWTVETLEKYHLRATDLCLVDDLGRYLLAQFSSLKDAVGSRSYDRWSEPIRFVVKSVRILHFSGAFLTFDMEVSVLLSPMLIPVFAVSKFLSSESKNKELL